MEIYDLGKLIKKLRTEHHLTQKKLADRLNVSEATICKYESNVSVPPFDSLRSLAIVFNISMDTLCGIKHQGTLSTHGLTEGQTDTLKSLIDVYRIKNTQTGGQATQEQLAVLGKIAIELTKKN